MNDRPPVVLLHAFPLDHRMWDDQVAALSGAGWRVEAWDLPGFGESTLPDADPSLDYVADLIAERLVGRDSPTILGGLSLGGYVVMSLARRSPELLAGILLCDTKAVADTEAARVLRLSMAEAVEADPTSLGGILSSAVLPNLVGPTTHAERPAVVARLTTALAQARPTSVAWYQRAMSMRPDSHQDLARLTVPSLVLWGAEDVLSPAADQERMIDSLPCARSVCIPRCGHLSALECPDEVSAALQVFLADSWAG